MQIFHILPMWFFLLLSSVLGADLSGEGVAAFRQGEYQKAAQAFADAEQKSPDDLRIVFNRGAALAASGKFDEATETLRRSAVAKDSAIAAKSLVLLGGIAVDRAKQLLAAKSDAANSDEVTREKRKEIFDQLSIAEKYYTESLNLEPSEPIRTNLEQIRAWKSRTQAAWEAVDRSQKRTDQMTKRLQWLEDWEGTIKDSIRKTNETPDSPKKFQTFYESAQEQSRLTEELTVLQNEAEQEFLKQESSDGNTSRQDTEAILQEFARLHTSAENITESLQKFQGDKAVEAATETANRLNRLRMNLAPFEIIVQEAEKKQAMLCNENMASGAVSTAASTPTLDIAEQSRQEQTVADWMPLMIFRAKQGLQAMDSSESTGQNQPQNAEALRRAMDLAVQTGPEIQTFTEDSSRLLAENQTEEALPKQKHALELLREILKQLQQNQDQQQQNQQGQDQKQNQSQEPNQDQDQKSQQQNQKEQQKSQQEQDKKSPQEKQPDKQSETKPEQQQQKKEASVPPEKKEEMEKAERMLRQVKRRQQEANEKRDRIRALLIQSAPVEKDW